MLSEAIENKKGRDIKCHVLIFSSEIQLKKFFLREAQANDF
jgi:hypothetical protein